MGVKGCSDCNSLGCPGKESHVVEESAVESGVVPSVVDSESSADVWFENVVHA